MNKSKKEKSISNFNFRTNGFINKKILFTLFWFLILCVIAVVVLTENFIPTTLTQKTVSIDSTWTKDWSSIQGIFKDPNSTTTLSKVNLSYWVTSMPSLFFGFNSREGLNITFVVFFIIALLLPALALLSVFNKFFKQAKLNVVVDANIAKENKVNNNLIQYSIIISIISFVILFLVTLVLIFSLSNLRQIPSPSFGPIIDGSFAKWSTYIESHSLVVNGVGTISLKPAFEYLSINDTVKYSLLSSVFVSIIPLTLISFSSIFIEWKIRREEKLLLSIKELEEKDEEIIANEINQQDTLSNENKENKTKPIKPATKSKSTSTKNTRGKKK